MRSNTFVIHIWANIVIEKGGITIAYPWCDGHFTDISAYGV